MQQMSEFHSTVVEHHDDDIGLLVPESRGFRFYAANDRFSALEGKLFGSALACDKAVRDLARQRRNIHEAYTAH